MSLSKTLFLLVLLVGSIDSVHAADGPKIQVNTVNLLRPPVANSSIDPESVHIHDFVAKDKSGARLGGVSAKLLVVYTGAFSWGEVKVENFADPIPPELKDQITLWYTGSAGWIVVPIGWKLVYAGIGADGSSGYTFVASTGSKDGWLVVGTGGQCEGCMYGAADGLIPGAHAEMESFMTDYKPPEPRLNPKPDSIHNPNACLAVFRYRQPESPPIHAVEYLGYPNDDPDGDMVETNLYVALPDKSLKLAEFITDYFQNQNSVCHGIKK